MHIGCYVVSLIILPLCVAAETVIPDFGPGLQKLAALGLPEMKDAEWVKPAGGEGGNMDRSYEFRELGLKFQGGIWKLPGEPPRQLGFGSAHVIEAEPETPAGKTGDPSAKPGLLEKMLRNHAASKPPEEKKPKALPSLDEDVKHLLESLAKPGAAAQMAQQAEYGRADMPGRILIFAAQLHAAGKTDSANKVAAAVFAAIPEKAVVIDAAIQQFAQRDHQKLTNSFFQDLDWKTYHDGLKLMLEKYPRGWQEGPAVSLLLPAVEKRVAGQLPAPAGLPGIEIKPEAQAALADLLAPPATSQDATDEDLVRKHGIDLDDFPAEQRAMILAQLRKSGLSGPFGSDDDETGLWLLAGLPAEPPSDPASRLTSMGMDGLIAFAAVSDDETLVPVRNQSYQSSYFGSGTSFEELALRRYQSLDRPRSRGEIARQYLAAVIPSTEEDEDEIDPSTLRESAIEFWKNHGTKTPLQLAQVYLQEGNSSQRSEAATFLASSDDPAAHAVFEKTVLAAEEPADFASDVENYLDLRKAAAKAFFDAFSKNLSASLDGVDPEQMRFSSGSYAIREAGSVEKYLKTLSIKVGAVSLKELVADAMKSGEPSDIEGLQSALTGAGTPDSLAAVGEVAGKATPDQLSQFCLMILQGISRGRDPEVEEEESEEDTPALQLPVSTLDLWRPLIDKSDPLPEQTSFGNWATSYGAKTTGDGIAMVLELCVQPTSGSQFNTYGDIQGSLAAIAPFVRTRVEAWINGKEAPAWPDESKVSETRQEEIAAQLAKLPAKDIPAFAMALPPDERAALASLIDGYDEENPAPASVLELRTRVIARRSFNPRIPHDDALLDQLGISEGYQFSAASLASLAERMAKESATFSGTQVSLFPAPMGLGSIASASRVSTAEGMNSSRFSIARWFQQFPEHDALAMLAIGNSANFWGMKDGKVEVLEAPRPADESLKEAFESKSVELPYLTVQVITRADAEKLNQEDE